MNPIVFRVRPRQSPPCAPHSIGIKANRFLYRVIIAVWGGKLPRTLPARPKRGISVSCRYLGAVDAA